MERLTIATKGPGASAPRPHAEAPLARRTALLAFAFFLAAALDLAWRGIDLATLQHAFPLYALGGASILIFGTSRLLIAGMAGREIAGGRSSAILTVAPAAGGAAGLFLLQDGPLAVAFALLWAVGPFAHAVVMLRTVTKPATRPPILDPTATHASRMPIRVLEAGSIAYALASAVLVPLAYAGRSPLAAALHVVLVGFVITTIMGTAAHILPRFTRRAAPTLALAALAPLALAGPALMAVGLHGDRVLLAAGGPVEGLAFALFAATILPMIARAHRFRIQDVAYAVAPVAVGAGGLVALAFVTRGALGEHLATHALLTSFGFVGLVVLAASSDLYGPALDVGARPAKRHVLVALALLLAGLALAAAGSSARLDVLARAGMAVYAAGLAWQLAGMAATHRRAERVVERLRRAKDR